MAKKLCIKSEMITVRCEEITKEQLKIISQRLHCSDSNTIQKALNYYFLTIEGMVANGDIKGCK